MKLTHTDLQAIGATIAVMIVLSTIFVFIGLIAESTPSDEGEESILKFIHDKVMNKKGGDNK